MGQSFWLIPSQTVARISRITLVTVFGFSFSQNGYAQQSWDTEHGEVVFESRNSEWIVWKFTPQGGNGRGRIFIDVLDSPDTLSGTYYGYWIVYDGAKPCATSKLDIEHNPSRHHGSFDVTFPGGDQRQAWSAKAGICEEPATQAWNGSPRLEQQVVQQSHGSTSVAVALQSEASRGGESEANGRCYVYRGRKMVDDEPCRRSTRNVRAVGVVEDYIWPSGGKTVIVRNNGHVSVNGADSVVDKNGRGDVNFCYLNKESGNTFCFQGL